MIASKVRQDQVIEATQLLFLMDLMRFSYITFNSRILIA